MLIRKIINNINILFLGYCYKVSENRTNWDTAKTICEEEDADLTSILTSKENDFIKGW